MGRKNILIILVVFLSTSSYGQCLLNYDFDQYCGVDEYPGGGGNYSFYDVYSQVPPYDHSPCVPYWHKSHGSPQIFAGATPAENVAYMWSQSNNTGVIGEGIWNDYIISPNTLYKIDVRVNVVQAAKEANAITSFKIYAANGVTDQHYQSGDPIPNNITDKQSIADDSRINQGWVPYSYNFITAGSNAADRKFTQIWVYPSTTSIQARVDFYVDYIKVCPDCDGTITYNKNSIPQGDNKAGHILVGSTSGTGGTGIVTVTSNAITTLIGLNDVDVLPETQVSLSGAGTFNIKIEPCSEQQSRLINRKNIDVSKFPKIDSILFSKQLGLSEDDSNGLMYYPNPVRDNLSIKLDLKKASKVEIRLMTSSGIVVRQIEKFVFSGQQTLNFNVADLLSGTYYLQIIDHKKVIAKKVVKL